MQSLRKFINRIFLSRSTIIALILAVLAAITTAALIPQHFATSPEAMLKWRESHILLSRLSDTLGLSRIYTHPLFAVILLGFLVSLLLSTWRQFEVAWRSIRTKRGTDAGPDSFDTIASLDVMRRYLRGHGYLRLSRPGESLRMVRHPWGYGGSALLHLGMCVVIAGALFIALTQQRAVIRLTQGLVQDPAAPVEVEEHGMLVAPLKLPEAVRLDDLLYSFHSDSYGIKSIKSKLAFIDSSWHVAEADVAVNRILRRGGMHYYQALEFGHAFLVECTGPEGPLWKYQLQVKHPFEPGSPSYETFGHMMPEGGAIRVKYVVNREMRNFDVIDPVLTLRIDQHTQEVGRVELKAGEEGTIGPYQFKLHGIAPWSQLIIVRIAGMNIVFLGFMFICLGGLLQYFMPPCEVVISENNEGGHTVRWRATRFAGFYREEYERLRREFCV